MQGMDSITGFEQELKQAFALPSAHRAKAVMLLCKSYVERYPELTEPYVTLAFLAHQAQCPQEAQRFLKQALQYSPFDARLQQIYQQINNPRIC